MAKTRSKMTLSASRDIPFNRLVLSQANVRRVKAGVSVEQLAQDIARRTLLQSLTVRPVRDADGVETGLYEIPAGGRRYRALALLVKQKRLAKTALIPCVVRLDGLAEEDSLAENVERAPLHPLDQFRAFQALRDKGQGEEEIAASFFVSVAVVRQRLRLASVSPKLLDLYADDAMTLDQLMAFTVTCDHARQDQVWDTVQRGHAREPYQIRRLLTGSSVRAADKRARFVGIAAYEAAGGTVQRDLFEADEGGWLADVALLDRLVADKLEGIARDVRAEGWRWVEAATEFPYGHTQGWRHLAGTPVPSLESDVAAQAALEAELEALEAANADADELPEAVAERLSEIEAALARLAEPRSAYDGAEMAIAGALVSIAHDGALRIARGLVRPEDEPAPAVPDDDDAPVAPARPEAPCATDAAALDGDANDDSEDEEAEDIRRPLSDRLMTELTQHRTLALREAIANDPDTAFLAVLHALCLRLFYPYGAESCLEITAKHVLFGSGAGGLGDTPAARAIEARHAAWGQQLPRDTKALWDALAGLDPDSRQALFAHCAGLTVNAVHEPWNRRTGALAHAGQLATATALDMSAAGWTATVDSCLGRVTKGQILDAVREARGSAEAERLGGLKKADMAIAAERRLAGTGWLPEPLRTPGAAGGASVAADDLAADRVAADADARATDFATAK